MPTLVNELSPVQLEWLYENQMTGGNTVLKEHASTMSGYLQSAASVFRDRGTESESEPPQKKRRREKGASSSLCSSACDDSVIFPHQGDGLTWGQHLENLRSFRKHYGVSISSRRRLFSGYLSNSTAQNTLVPLDYTSNPALAEWVHEQRRRYSSPSRSGSLSRD